MSGYVVSDELKAIHSKNSKARWNNPEWRNRIIENRHKPESTYQSEEFKRKISFLVSGEKNPNYGNHWTDEQKQKLSEKRKANGKSKGVLNNRAKSIQCVETGEVFQLIKDAMKKYHVKCEGSFSVALDNPKRTAAGLHWVTISPKTHNSPLY